MANVCIYICVCVCMHVCMYKCMYVEINGRTLTDCFFMMYVYVCMCVYVEVSGRPLLCRGEEDPSPDISGQQGLLQEVECVRGLGRLLRRRQHDVQNETVGQVRQEDSHHNQHHQHYSSADSERCLGRYKTICISI